MSDDPRIKEYFDYLWAMYKKASSEMNEYRSYADWGAGFAAGKYQGLSEAVETLKSTFELAEYADTSQPTESHGK